MTNRVAARKKAREAAASLLAARREREKKMEAALEEFFSAEALRAAAEEALANAQCEEDAKIADLTELGLSGSEIAKMIGRELGDVRKALRRHAKKQVKSEEDTDE